MTGSMPLSDWLLTLLILTERIQTTTSRIKRAVADAINRRTIRAMKRAEVQGAAAGPAEAVKASAREEQETC